MTRKRIPQCFPLCRLEIPELSQNEWETFAQDHVANRHDGTRAASSGILIAEDHRSYILGFLVHGIDRDLNHGRILQAKWMVVQDYFPAARQEVALALLSALEDLAEASACRSIQTTLPVPRGRAQPFWLSTILQTRGHRHHSAGFCKTLATHS